MNPIEGTHVHPTTHEQYSYTATIDPTGFRAKVRNADGDLVGEPSIVHRQTLSDTPASREAACHEWIKSSINDRVGVR